MEQITSFKALRISIEEDRVIKCIEDMHINDLPDGDVLIKVHYSSLNYKDALSAAGNKGITKKYPHTPGIDAAGTVVQSRAFEFSPGDEVVCMGYDLGMNTCGGFGQYIRVPAQWVIKKPENLTLMDTMKLGTAGFTAAQCVSAIQEYGLGPDSGPILVTGATGGVAVISALLLAKLGYAVHGLTGKNIEPQVQRELGYLSLIDRAKGLEGSEKLLLKEQWAGVVDTVGGEILANAVKATMYDGVVTSCGNAFSGELPLTVYPFILRGVHLIGIYSANCPMEKRLKIWDKLAGPWKLDTLDTITHIITLEELPFTIEQMLSGKTTGRTVVRLWEEL